MLGSRPRGLVPPSPLRARLSASSGAILRYLIVAVVFTVLWLNLHWLAAAYETAPGSSAWYPARGLSLALLLIFGLRYAPVLLIGSLLAGAAYHLPEHPQNLLLNAFGITAWMTLAAWALRRLGVGTEMRQRDGLALIAVGAVAALGAACSVVAVNMLSGLVPAGAYWSVVLQFFVGDFIGIVIVVPLALAVVGASAHRRAGRFDLRRFVQRLLEGLLIVAISLALLWQASDSLYGVAVGAKPGGLYLLLLPAALVALRFGPLGSAVTTLALSSAAIAAVRLTSAPSERADIGLFLLSLAMVSLLLSGATNDQRRLARILAASQRDEAARARRDAELARRSKARFIAATTHDLRPPLEAVRLGLETLALKPLPADAEPLLRRSLSSVRSLGRVLDSVLDMARLEGELQAVSPRALRLGPLLERVAAESAANHPLGAAAVRVRPTPLAVVADQVVLERLLRNLLVNALRACAPAGRVLVVARRRGLAVRVEVYDSGPGIAAERLPRLFEDFVSDSEGTGIGLSLVRETADRLGLRLRVRSLPGQGTMFGFELPAASAGASAAVQDRVIALAMRDPVRRELLVTVLGEWGAAVLAGAVPELLQSELERLGTRADLLVVDEALFDQRAAAAETLCLPWQAGWRIILR